MDFVGLIPAAGKATRLAPFRYPKELLPIGYEPTPDGGARPRAVAEYGVEVLKAAGIGHMFLVVAPWKLDIVTYFGDGAQLGVSIGYLFQEEARGLPNAIDIAHSWTGGRHVALVLPDTILRPADALARLRARYLDSGADLALAVFPTDQAWRLGPVVLRGGTVERVLDKPRGPAPANTWGAAIWGGRFADLLHEGLAQSQPGSGRAGPGPVLRPGRAARAAGRGRRVPRRLVRGRRDQRGHHAVRAGRGHRRWPGAGRRLASS